MYIFVVIQRGARINSLLNIVTQNIFYIYMYQNGFYWTTFILIKGFNLVTWRIKTKTWTKITNWTKHFHNKSRQFFLINGLNGKEFQSLSEEQNFNCNRFFIKQINQRLQRAWTPQYNIAHLLLLPLTLLNSLMITWAS